MQDPTSSAITPAAGMVAFAALPIVLAALMEPAPLRPERLTEALDALGLDYERRVNDRYLTAYQREFAAECLALLGSLQATVRTLVEKGVAAGAIPPVREGA